MRDIKVVGFDLDGTVIHPITRRVSDRVGAALQAAHDGGASCCIVSGRPYSMIEPEVAHAPWCDWIIASSGALVRSEDGACVLQHLAIPYEHALRIVEELADLEPALYVSYADAAYRDVNVIPYLRSRDDLAQDWDKAALESSLAAFLPIESVPDEMRRRGQDPLKFNVICPRQGMVEEAIRRMRALGGLQIDRMIDNSELELTAAGVDKGDAFELVLEHLGIPESAAVAFGDGGNDLPLSGREFTFVAMGNAVDAVKDAADEVCGHVDDDGVALWLEERLGL